MPHYTIANLGEVEDKAPQFGMDGIEARFARGALEMEQGGASYYKLAPGYRLPFGHRHERQEELYVLIAGSGRIRVEDEIEELRPLDAVRVPGPLARGFEAGPDGAELLAFGAPNTDNKDVEMLPGWWPAD